MMCTLFGEIQHRKIDFRKQQNDGVYKKKTTVFYCYDVVIIDFFFTGSILGFLGFYT